MSRRPPAFPTGQLLRILTLALLLVAVVFMKSRCGKAAEQMFRAIEVPAPSPSGNAASPPVGDGGHH